MELVSIRAFRALRGLRARRRGDRRRGGGGSPSGHGGVPVHHKKRARNGTQQSTARWEALVHQRESRQGGARLCRCHAGREGGGTDLPEHKD